MRFGFERMPPVERFEAMTGAVVPRPVALVTSLDARGRLNAAPYSLFAALAIDPPLLAIGVLPHAEARSRDTCVTGSGRPHRPLLWTAAGARGRCLHPR
jgi:Flavin reductase like domain